MPIDPDAQAVRPFGSAIRRRRDDFTELERSLLPPSRPFTSDDTTNARLWALVWADYGFAADEVRAWLAAGLEPDDSGTAVMLLEEGIAPDRLEERLVHPGTGEPMTILDVARTVTTNAADDHAKTAAQIFDEAGIKRRRGQPVLARSLEQRRA